MQRVRVSSVCCTSACAVREMSLCNGMECGVCAVYAVLCFGTARASAVVLKDGVDGICSIREPFGDII